MATTPTEDIRVDAKTLLASAPMIRKAWRLVPGPLRIPLIIGAAIVWFVKRGDDDGTGEAAGDASSSGPA